MSETTDTERLNKLEALLWSNKIGNGLALFPCVNSETGQKRMVFQDLGEEDGSNLGDELTDLKPSLRESIDALPKP